MSLTAYALTPWSFIETAGFGGHLAAADPTILFDGTIYRMFYTDGPIDGSVVRPVIAGAVSADGVTWTQLGGNGSNGIVLSGDGGDAANVEGACIFKAGDLYILLYSSYADTGFPVSQFPARLFAAVSTDGIHFEPASTQAVMTPTAGWFDNDAIYSPTVITLGGNYFMLYAGHCYTDTSGTGGTAGVSLLAATSPDGINWTKTAAPVLRADPSIAWMSDGVAEPSLITGPDGKYYLFFTGLDGSDRSIGLAVATDPLGSWEIVPQPIVTAADTGLPAGSTVIAPHAELVNGVLRLWYTAVTPDGAHKIAYAESDWGGGATAMDGPPHWLGTELNDTIYGGAAGDLVTAGDGADLIVTDGGNDTIDAGAGDDEVWAGDGNDSVLGRAGNDALYGGVGANTMDGGDGADLLAGDLGADRLLGGIGDDTIDGGDGADTIDGGDGDDRVWSGEGNDSILGGAGDDVLVGGNGADTIDGGSGADIVAGDADADLLRGGTGNDTIYAGDDADVIDAGDDDDVVWASGGNDSVAGGLGRDVLYGGEGANTMDGGADADTLIGGAEADRLLGNTGDDQLDGGDGADMLLGGAGLDLLDGGSGNDTLDGGDGADTLHSGIYDDGLSANSLVGGLGNDLLLAFAGRDTLDGGAGNDVLDGGGDDDLLLGGDGTDGLYGGEGDDSLVGGALADTMDGGTGTDTADYSRSGAVTASLGGSVAGTGDAAGDIFISVERIIGSATGSDRLIGDGLTNWLEGLGGNDTLDGGAAADVLTGGAGNDLYIADSALDMVVELAGGGTDTVLTTASFQLAANVENLAVQAGVAAGLWLIGNGLSNGLTGGAGGDTLEGGLGADTMAGGAGNDVYLVERAADVVTEAVGAGTDIVVTTVSLTLAANVENLSVLTGVSAGLALTGNGLGNILTGGAGHDTLNGGAGGDTLSGGAGDDLYIVDSTADIVFEGAASGTDTVRTSVNFTLGANIENLSVTAGVSADLALTGNTLNNVIIGGGGRDMIVGGGGNDTFVGGLNADTLQGGAGNDHLTGGAGHDRLIGNAGSDSFIFNAALGAASNLDHIVDFSAVDDTIHLENAIFTGLGTATGVLSAAAFRSGAGVTGAADADDRILYNTSTGELAYDADGIGGVAAVKFAVLDNKALLTAADFLII